MPGGAYPSCRPETPTDVTGMYVSTVQVVRVPAFTRLNIPAY